MVPFAPTRRELLRLSGIGVATVACLPPYMQQTAGGLLKEKKIAAIPDWSRALRREFMARARA